jgi:hypothetical protein
VISGFYVLHVWADFLDDAGAFVAADERETYW